MAAWRRAIELSLGDEDTAKLRTIAQSRTEPASRVESVGRRVPRMGHQSPSAPPGQKADPALQLRPRAPHRQTALSRPNSPRGKSTTGRAAELVGHSNACQAFCSRSRARNSRRQPFRPLRSSLPDQKCQIRSIDAIQAKFLSGAIADTLQFADAGHAFELPLKALASRE
jgi:hypothetical protein